MIGAKLGNYRILEKIGAGGQGTVYKATDTKLGRAVVIKVLPPELTVKEANLKRFEREARLASALDHPNICTVYEIDETADGQLFIAMAHYEGETLKARMAHGAMPVDTALLIFTGVVRAVAAAHQAGIVHRDIKPANIIVTSRGDVKLLDFGIAKLEGQSALTRTGTTLGTVAYMAPEQVTGRLVDARADVWSLGVVLFELLAGSRPFDGPHDAAIFHAIVNGAPRSLADARPDVPPAIVRLVSRALEKAPEARFATAGEMLRELEALRAAPSATTARAVVPIAPSTGSRAPWIVVAVILIALAGAGGWYARQQSRMRQAHAQLATLETLIQKEHPAQAYRLMLQLEPALGTTRLLKIRDGFLSCPRDQEHSSGADVITG